MASRQTLLTVSYHDDDDTGMYEIGEIDHGIVVGSLENYLIRYGYDGLRDIQSALAHLMWAVEDTYSKLPRPEQAQSGV